MSATKQRRTVAETWDALMKDAEEDAVEAEMARIAALSPEDLDRELAADGFDPARVREEGEAFVATLMARAEKEAPAAARLDRERARLVQRQARRGKLPRAALEARIMSARNDPRLPAPLAVQFRNRGAEEASLEELESMLDQLEGALEDIGGDGDGDGDHSGERGDGE